MPRNIVTIVYNSCIHVVRSRLELIAALQKAGYEVVVVAPTDDATPKLAELGIAHRSIGMNQYSMNPIRELRTAREIRSILKELRPIVSLHYTIKPNTFGSMAAHQLGLPVLNNIAGAGRAFSEGSRIMRALVILLYRFSLRKSHTVYFQNSDDMQIFQDAKLVRQEQCVRIPGSGVDLDRFQSTPLPSGPTRFLYVGRMLKEKGVVEFLDAANTLLSEVADPNGLRFDLVGEFEDDRGYIGRTDLERMTIAPQITYHGKVAPENIDGMMQESSCVVLPSYYGEGVPRVLLEACASGRPIITTDNVGCRDVIEPGKNGWIVPPRDTQALVEALRAHIESTPVHLAMLSKGARSTAETRFDEKIVIERYLQRISAATAR